MTAATRPARPGANLEPLRGRGHPTTIRTTSFVAALIEGQVFAGDVMTAAGRMQTLAATGERARLVHEAGAIGGRAQAFRAELRRIAGEIES